MKVVIVDDEPLARAAIRLRVQKDRELTVIAEGSGRCARTLISRVRPDILFLNIQMSGVDGIAVLEKVGPGAVPAVIFAATEASHALRAFEVNALDYLVRPFDDTRFFRAVARAKERVKALQQYARHYLVRSRGKTLFVRTRDIDWIGSADNYVSLYVRGESHLLRRTLDEMEGELDPRNFVRVHRSAIVNTERLKELRPLARGDSALVLEDGTCVPLSRRRREELERRIGARP